MVSRYSPSPMVVVPERDSKDKNDMNEKSATDVFFKAFTVNSISTESRMVGRWLKA